MFYRAQVAADLTSQASADAQAANAAAREAKTQIEFMRHDVDRLLLITQALWTFMKKEHGYSDEDLTKLITEIDLQDGRLDGKVAQQPAVACPACGKANTAKRRMCIYCGKPLPMAPFAR